MDAAGVPREAGFDLARGVAVLSMYVAHFAPAAGPGQVLGLSEFLTAPLFAFLVGAGVELGRRRTGWWAGWWTALVRAAVLVGLGLALARTDAQIVVILVHLGVVLLVVSVLRPLPWPVLAGVALVLVAVTALRAAEGDGGPYRVTELAALAIAGVLLVRWWSRRRPSPARLSVLAAGAGLPAAGLLVLDRLGVERLRPYTGTVAVQLFDLALVVGAACACLALAAVVGPRLLAPVVATGAMALSAYVAQVLVAAAWVPRHPTDNSWALLLGLGAGTLLAATLWRGLAPGRWRGPLEVLIDLLVGVSARRHSAHRAVTATG